MSPSKAGQVLLDPFGPGPGFTRRGLGELLYLSDKSAKRLFWSNDKKMKNATSSVFAALALALPHTSAVSLTIYVESGCPGCEALILGDLNETLTSEGMYDAIDYTFLSFGMLLSLRG